MLVVTRTVGEQIVIGDAIMVSILAIKGKKIRVGIDAPTSISVHRREVFEAMKEEREGKGPDEFGSLTAPAERPSGPRSPIGLSRNDVHEAIQVLNRYCLAANPDQHAGLLDDLRDVVDLLQSRNTQRASL